jgi:hypothetical protein
MRFSSRVNDPRPLGAKIANQNSSENVLLPLSSEARSRSGSADMTPAVVIIQKWGDFMEAAIAHARAVFRSMWRWPELYVAIVVFSLLMRIIFNAAFQEKIAEHLRGQIEVIKEQNERSIADRTYLHEELGSAKAALKRLERTVKTGEYP